MPSYVAAEERDIVDAAVAGTVDHIVCGRLTRGITLEPERRVNERTSLLSVASGKNGDDLLEALRMRVIAACAAGASVTPSGVSCP